MSTRADGERGERGRARLRKETVARAALALVDAGGLESLTMRRLATALDAQLPTIYRLFDGKQALMDELADLVLAEALTRMTAHQADDNDADWSDSMTAFIHAVRQALLAQRDGARIVGGSYATRAHTHTQALANTALEVLTTAGFPPDTALRACTTLFSYTLGEVLEQQGTNAYDPETLNSPPDTDTYPHLTPNSLTALLDFDARFAFGLRVVMTGLRAELAGLAPDK